MNEFEKYKRYLKADMIVLIIFSLIGIGILIFGGIVTDLLNDLKVIMSLVFNIIYMVIFILCYISAKNGKKSAYILGFLSAIIYIISLDFINILLGIIVLIHSMKYKNNYIETNVI